MGYNYPKLANRLGYVASYVRSAIAGAKNADPARRRIEDFIGKPIWTSPAEFKSRQAANAARIAASQATPERALHD